MSPDSRLGFHLLGFAGAIGRPALTAEQPGLLLLAQAIALALDVDGGRVKRTRGTAGVARVGNTGAKQWLADGEFRGTSPRK